MNIRTGVIGLGMGRNHARQYHECTEADLVALCDVDTDRLAMYRQQYPSVEIYTDYQEMLQKADLDAISVALPNFLHDTVAIDALHAGIHVLCEKPLAINAQRAEAMLAAARASDRILMVHFNYRYTPPARFLKTYVDEGHLGRLYYARTRWLRSRGIPKPGGWFGIKERSGGGPVIDLGVHRLDLALWLMGYPRVLSVSASTFDLLGTRLAREMGVSYDVEDLATALIRLDNWVTLTLEVSWAGGTDRREDMLTALYGEDGGAMHRNRGEGYEFEAVCLQDCAGALTQLTPQRYPEGPNAIEDFCRCVRDGAEPDARAEHGVALMHLIDAIYLSAAEHREVRLDSQ